MYVKVQRESRIESEFPRNENIRVKWLSGENIETDCAAQAVAEQTYATPESRISLQEETVHTIHFTYYSTGHTCTELWCVIQQNIQKH
jgi:hypothetical protein